MIHKTGYKQKRSCSGTEPREAEEERRTSKYLKGPKDRTCRYRCRQWWGRRWGESARAREGGESARAGDGELEGDTVSDWEWEREQDRRWECDSLKEREREKPLPFPIFNLQFCSLPSCCGIKKRIFSIGPVRQSHKELGTKVVIADSILVKPGIGSVSVETTKSQPILFDSLFKSGLMHIVRYNYHMT